MKQLIVLNPGLLSTIQDAGRLGSQAFGIPASGCMDQQSLRDANALLGNPPDTAVIEMLYIGGSFRFGCQTCIALTGADMQARLNGQPVPTYTPLEIRPGDTLTLGTAITGRFGYLSVAGGFDLPPVFGSLSTYIKCGIGGYQGRALKAGDAIPLIDTALTAPRKTLSAPAFSQDIIVRVVPGPQVSLFPKDVLKQFFSASYQVTDQSDRMGYRLEGPSLTQPTAMDAAAETTATAAETLASAPHSIRTDIISDGTAFGSIQVPGSGQPIILLADRQTTGGYAKIGTVISPDLPALVQCLPGALIHFQPVTPRKAAAIYCKEQKKRRRSYRRLGYIEEV